MRGFGDYQNAVPNQQPGRVRTGLEGYYVYPLQLVLAAASGAQTTGQINVVQNMDFEVFQVQTTQTGNYSVIWGTSTVAFMPSFVKYQNIFATAILPHPLPERVIFPRGSIIAVTLRNDTVLANTVDLAFEGRLVQST